MCSRDNFLGDGSDLNQSIMSTSGNIHNSKGPLLLMRQPFWDEVDAPDSEPKKEPKGLSYVDLTLADRRYGVDFLEHTTQKLHNPNSSG